MASTRPSPSNANSTPLATPPPSAASATTPPPTTPSHLHPPPTLPSFASASISLAEIKYITAGCASDLRLDGRTRLSYRPYTLSVTSSPTLPLSNGSSRIHLPNRGTDVLCSVKAELVRPRPSHPREGVVELNIEHAVPGGGSNKRHRRNWEMELRTVLSRLVLPHCADWKSLCIVPGKYVWRLSIDVLLVSCNGNVLGVSSMAIRSALSQTLLPIVTPVRRSDGGVAESSTATTTPRKAGEELTIDGDIARAVPPKGADDCPVVVTVAVLKSGRRSVMIVDPTSEEEACAACRVSVAVDGEGRVCGVHKSAGEGGGSTSSTLSLGALEEITNVAIGSSRKVIELLGKRKEEDGGRGEGDEDLLRGHFELR